MADAPDPTDVVRRLHTLVKLTGDALADDAIQVIKALSAAHAAPSTGLSEEQVEEVVRRLLARSKEYALASSGTYDWPDGASHGLSVAAGVVKRVANGGEQ